VIQLRVSHTHWVIGAPPSSPASGGAAISFIRSTTSSNKLKSNLTEFSFIFELFKE
jgi:hypothetical protein